MCVSLCVCACVCVRACVYEAHVIVAMVHVQSCSLFAIEYSRFSDADGQV